MKFTELVDSGASKTKQHEYLVDGEQTAITIRIPSNLKDAYNNNFIIKDIPEAAQRYTVNGRSPLEWIIDRYQVKTDKASSMNLMIIATTHDTSLTSSRASLPSL